MSGVNFKREPLDPYDCFYMNCNDCFFYNGSCTHPENPHNFNEALPKIK